MIDPTVIDAMVASGCTAEQIAAVVKAAMSADAERLAEKREYDRIRKRDQRARNTPTITTIVSELSKGHSGTNGDIVDIDYAPPSPKESPHTPKETPPSTPTTLKEKTPKGVQKKGSRLPSDFEPDFGFAEVHGLSRSQAEAEAAKFRDYWAAKAGQGATKQDWQATWRNWVRSAVERLGPRRRDGPSFQANSRPPQLADIFKTIGDASANERTQRESFEGFGGNISYLPAVGSR